MGLFNSSILLSENDVNSMDFTFLLRYVNNPKEKDQEEERSSPGRSKLSVVEDDDNGFKTPTSLEHKIPKTLRCPMAPRKPKPKPLLTKRKAAERQRFLLDLSTEIQSLFPPDFLLGLGGKIKRPVTQETNQQKS